MKMRFAALMTALLVIFGMTACGNGFDAAAYVKGSLDAVQTGTVSDELAGITNETKDELQAEIDEIRDEAKQSLLDSMGDEEKSLTDDAKKSISSAVEGLFSKMKYEVSEDVTRDGDDYTVKVKAYPMTCLDEFADWIGGDFVSEWVEKAGSYTSQDKFMKDMYAACFAKLDEMVQNTEYGDAQDMAVKVVLNDSGVYEADQDNIEELITVLLGTAGIEGLSN